MFKLTYKSVLIILLISFIAMNTGFLMFIHLNNVKHQEHHNHNECQICQQSLLSSKKAIVQSKSAIQEIEPFADFILFIIQKKRGIFEFQSFFTRGPPAAFINS